MRLPDQFMPAGAVFAAGIFMGERSERVLLWAVASTLLSVVAFMVNELVDRHDTDKYSQNTIHVSAREHNHTSVVAGIVVVFSSVALWFSYSVGLLGWALLMFVICILYSLKPIRLKGVFGLDLATQTVASLVIPFVAPLIQYGHFDRGVFLVALSLSLPVTAGFLLYQLCDIAGDRKAKLSCTHVVLGEQKSLVLGFILCVVGVLLFLFVWKLVWLWVFVPFSIVTAGYYWVALKKASQKAKIAVCLSYRHTMKPIARLLLPYFLMVWLLVA